MDSYSRIPLTMENIVEYNEKKYLFAYLSNTIIEVDSPSNHIKVIKRIPWDTTALHDFPDYGFLHIYKNKFYLLPDLAGDVCVYNMIKDRIEYISIPGSKKNVTEFYGGAIEGHNLYLVPCNRDVVVMIDMEKDRAEIIECECLKGHGSVAWGSICNVNGKILFTELESDNLYYIDTKNNNIGFVSTGIGHGLSGVMFANDTLWVIPKHFDKIYSLNNDYKVCREYNIDINGYNPGEWSIHKAVCIDGIIYIMPRMANKLLYFDSTDYSFNEIRMENRDLNNRIDKFVPVSNVFKLGNRVYYIQSKTGIIIDIEEGKEKLFRVIKPNAGFILGNPYIYESNNGFDNLENYIGFLLSH